MKAWNARNPLWRIILMVTGAAIATTLVSPSASAQDWRIGEIVGLCKGTHIYEGPGYGYRYHTIVPDNDWAVKIIDGPRNGDWWDTSRKEAGDPSGGTG